MNSSEAELEHEYFPISFLVFEDFPRAEAAIFEHSLYS